MRRGNIEVISTEWFNGDVGVIYAVDVITMQKQVYIGSILTNQRGMPIASTEEYDIYHIIDCGFKMDLEFFKLVINGQILRAEEYKLKESKNAKRDSNSTENR